MNSIGNRIKELREQAGISARSLAKITNLDPSQISKIERGVSKPSLDALERICEALNITLADFFSVEDQAMLPEQRQLLQATNLLTVEQMNLLKKFLETFKEK